MDDNERNMYGWKARLLQINEDIATLENDREKMEELIASIENDIEVAKLKEEATA